MRHDETNPRGPRSSRRRGSGTRRDFLRGSGVLASLGIVGALARSLHAEPPEDAKRALARSGPLDVDAMARLIEDTPRERVFDVVASALRDGTPVAVFEGAILLAAVRCVDPGENQYHLHCIFALNAARVLGSAMPREDEALPLFWVLDFFKRGQDGDAWRRGAEVRLRDVAPTTRERAAAALEAAAQDGDPERAAAAVVGLWRGRVSTSDVFEALWEHGARDLDTLGHRAIYVANLRRTLDLIGTDRAEPAFVSLTAMLFDGARPEAARRSWEECVERAAAILPRLPASWDGAADETSQVRGLAACMLAGDVAAARGRAADALVDGGLRAQDAWDAVHVAAGCVVMDYPKIISTHAVSSTNALHYGFRSSRDPRTRLLLLLTAVGWTAEFAARHRANLTAVESLDLVGERPSTDGKHAAAEILDSVSTNPPRAARLAFALAEHGGQDVADFVREASCLVVAKADDPHKYKFPVAAFEDFAQTSPRWRPHVFGAATSFLRGSREPDAGIILRAREALRR
jgi:hypothetical protein